MTVGNAVALLQRDLKRLLAYSSIAHAGYLMVGITASFANGPKGGQFFYGSEGIFFYLAAYALMTLGVFGVVVAMKRADGRSVDTIDDLAGLGFTQPLPALAMTVCLLSLTGFPGLAGFWGKLQIFASAFSAQSGEGAWSFYMLTIIGVLNAAVGAFYYLRIIVLMYLHPASGPLKATGGWPVAMAVGACASLSLLIGVYPAPVSEACRQAAVAAANHEQAADDAAPIALQTLPPPRFGWLTIDPSVVGVYA